VLLRDGLFDRFFEGRAAVTFPSPMALGLRNVLEQLVAVGKTSSPFGVEVSGIKLAAT
jgi:hypothetical protein